MPYKSKAQAAYMHAAEERGEIKPSVVHEFDAASKGKMGHLPGHVRKMSDGGMVCYHCGGRVEADGYAEGGEVDDDEYGDIKAMDKGVTAARRSETPSETPAARLLAAAIRRKSGER